MSLSTQQVSLTTNKSSYNSEYHKKYYKNNIEYYKEYQQKYYAENTDKISQKKKIYYENNKEKIRTKQNENTKCDVCNSIVFKRNLKRHKESKKCIEYKFIEELMNIVESVKIE